MNDTVIDVKNLTKKFGSFTAVNDISFSVEEGEIIGLLGPNGAGKTTILRMLLSVIIPDSGEIILLGKNLLSQREEILKYVNFTFINNFSGGRLSVDETLKFFALLYEVKDIKNKINSLLERFEIAHLKNKKTRELSSGEVARVSICKALINNPRILFLDEPTANLDPDIADRTRRLIKEIKKEFQMTVLYTSHNMQEVEEMCDKIIFLNHGKIVVQGSPLEITQQIIHESAVEPSIQEVFLRISRGKNHE